MSSNKRSYQTAFTIVEVLLGLIVSSFVMLCVYGICRSGFELNRRFEAGRDKARQVQMAMDIFANDLENSVAYDFSGSYKGRYCFEGEKDKVVFLLREETGLKMISYYIARVKKDDIRREIVAKHVKSNTPFIEEQNAITDDLSLVREEMEFRDYLSSRLQVSGIKEAILGSMQEKGLSLLYAKANDAGREITWMQDCKGYRPKAVKISLKFLDKDKERHDVVFKKTVIIPSEIEINEIH